MAIVRVKYPSYNLQLSTQAIIDFPEGVEVKMAPHVQRLCDDIERQFGYVYFGTYPGHDPDIRRAVDGHVAKASYSSDGTRGDLIVEWLLPRLEYYGGDYLIWRPGIWNPPDRAFWRARARTGNPTQDHYDHFHIGFLEDAPVNHEGPQPEPDQPEEEMKHETESAIQHFDTLMDKFCRSVGKAYDGVEDGYHGAEVIGEFFGRAIKSWKK